MAMQRLTMEECLKIVEISFQISRSMQQTYVHIFNVKLFWVLRQISALKCMQIAKFLYLEYEQS